MIKFNFCTLFSLLSMIGLAVAANDTSCVQTYDDLQKCVADASITNYTQISICTELILLEGVLDVTNKWIDLKCTLSKGQRCTLDAQKKTNLIYGTKAHFKSHSIDFINGIGVGTGPIYLDNSYVSMTKCSIMNSGNTAITAQFWGNEDFSTISLILQDVNFINNSNKRSTLSIYGKKYKILRTHFSNNTGRQIGIYTSGGVVANSIFENSSVSNVDGNVEVSFHGDKKLINAFRNTTFLRNAQPAKSSALYVGYGAKVTLNNVVFRENYGLGGNYTVRISGNTPTLQCLGVTKFCDNFDPSYRLVDDYSVPYAGSTNCLDLQFMIGC